MKRVMSLGVLAGLLSIGLSGCVTGGWRYTPPSSSAQDSNSKVIDKPRAEVWKEAVPALGKKFFVINTIDQSSGLINLSYSGDPEKYVNCGEISSHVQNMRGSRSYDFPAARAEENYEVVAGNALIIVNRKMSLEGRVNLIFEDAGPGKTKVTANTRYVITKTTQAQNVAGGFPVTSSDHIAFDTNGSGSYSNGPITITCVPNGQLERDILSAVE